MYITTKSSVSGHAADIMQDVEGIGPFSLVQRLLQWVYSTNRGVERTRITRCEHKIEYC